jgi:hypothetical protein
MPVAVSGRQHQHGACPFCQIFSTTCRNEPDTDERFESGRVWFILCKECGARGPLHSNPANAWAAWNEGVNGESNPNVSPLTP